MDPCRDVQFLAVGSLGAKPGRRKTFPRRRAPPMSSEKGFFCLVHLERSTSLVHGGLQSCNETQDMRDTHVKKTLLGSWEMGIPQPGD